MSQTHRPGQSGDPRKSQPRQPPTPPPHNPDLGPSPEGVEAYESAFALAINQNPASVESARQQSHDTVIANTGRARRSGVKWTGYRPAASAEAQLRATGLDLELPQEMRDLIAMYPQGVLVIATVLIDPKVQP